MRSDGLCGTVTCDSEYPPRVAFSLLTKLLEDFSVQIPSWRTEKKNESIVWPPLEDAVHTIETVLQRGEKLEDLVERSGELSAQSKLFYKQAKRANSCCVII